jgi:O-antigen ligase
LSFALERIHSRALCAVIIFGVLIALNMLTIGSTQFDAIKSFNDAVLSDPTFTGRNDIWLFSIESIKDRPWFGHGFGAFWETPATFFLPMTEGSQVASASHAHNAFLDLALTVGLPGLALAIVWTMVLPFRDLQRCKAIGAHPELTTLFVRLWLFGVYTCSFESFLFDRGNPNWFTMLVAMFGLRYLATSRLSVEADRRHLQAVATT